MRGPHFSIVHCYVEGYVASHINNQVKTSFYKSNLLVPHPACWALSRGLLMHMRTSYIHRGLPCLIPFMDLSGKWELPCTHQFSLFKIFMWPLIIFRFSPWSHIVNSLTNLSQRRKCVRADHLPKIESTLNIHSNKNGHHIGSCTSSILRNYFLESQFEQLKGAEMTEW